MNKSRRISFLIMAALLVLIGVFHLGVLLLTALFGYFALQALSFRRNKTIGVVLYLIVIIGVGFGLFVFSKRAYRTLPKIADETIPKLVDYADHKGIDLGFSNSSEAKKKALDTVQEKLTSISHYAREALFQLALL